MLMDPDPPLELERARARAGTPSEPIIRVLGGKPRLRGIPDVVAVLAFVPLAAWLMASTAQGAATVAATIYGLSVILLFGVSATYHTPMWSRSIRDLWRRLDHSMIFVATAATYTPPCLLLLDAERGTRWLIITWSVAALGVLKCLLWPSAPRVLNTTLYIGFGWMALPLVGDFWTHGGPWFVGLVVLGGVVYSVGGVVYARRWPNPWPATFGYHEVFHLFVVAAAACHFAAMTLILL